MSRSLNLTRHCLGLDTRIECVVLPLAGNNGLWTLICAAGMARLSASAATRADCSVLKSASTP